MNVENQVHPSPENVKGFVAVEGPVAMVNLLKFKDRAEYKDGRETELSGREAYSLYATEMKKLVEGSGGRFIFSAHVKNLLLGKVDELWDSVGIVEYPTSKDLIRISASPEFQQIEVHREAGLAGQLNITCQEGTL